MDILTYKISIYASVHSDFHTKRRHLRTDAAHVLLWPLLLYLCDYYCHMIFPIITFGTLQLFNDLFICSSEFVLKKCLYFCLFNFTFINTVNIFYRYMYIKCPLVLCTFFVLYSHVHSHLLCLYFTLSHLQVSWICSYWFLICASLTYLTSIFFLNPPRLHTNS